MKILTIVGARPQFIKAAMLNRAIRARNDMSEVLVHTGQHHDAQMSDVFFQQLDIQRPQHSLGVSGGTHGDMTGRMMIALDPVLQVERPDLVLVYGDTNSTLAAAVCASKFGIPLAHVEAGLRSFNRAMPEEINRVLTDHLANYLFCPTRTAVENLQREGIVTNVHDVGDIMYDAALHYGNSPDNAALLSAELREVHQTRAYVLATIHRQENTDAPQRLGRIMDGILELADAHPVVLPLHPRTRGKLDDATLKRLCEHKQVYLTEPLGYLEMLQLERNAQLILTDSGGVQKEAFFFKVPCATLRDQTEWKELVDHGWNTLIDVSIDPIADRALRCYGRAGHADFNPYGEGHTSETILSTLISA
ncbi:UDP-N-acetylglucosamine 2-epimerase (non-hydrolyzing) [Paucibacter aquatile]|uniref:UDP-N-acetylglucosamine 2-epimerase (Non-hydrolyzing) n=1 Tax=Kinneretia aquatilis TaxID=2070761 RepID=A0A2N8KWE7_9BURK|nr:UDP-N-acetylglucosamine 2-epimerase (non-hydrolyzing) [Paucibacter aquatile]PND37777.1 UDP-N-acetylglucosamine 2-epimerase (non-hydrolyzing) [Paucibacter aquatile]